MAFSYKEADGDNSFSGTVELDVRLNRVEERE